MDATEMHFDRATLMRELNESWTTFNNTLAKLTESQMTEIHDVDGWTVKDHLAHITAWENSIVVYLQGRPQVEGLGVSEELFAARDTDGINAAIYARSQGKSLADVLAEMHETHRLLLELVEPLSDQELGNPRGAGGGDRRAVSGKIYVNTTEHYREHQGWIESLVSKL